MPASRNLFGALSVGLQNLRFWARDMSLLSRFASHRQTVEKPKDRPSSTSIEAPEYARPPHPTSRDGQALGSTAGIVLPSESAKGYTKPTANDARSSLVPDSHDQRSRDRKRSRDDLQTREAGVRRSTPTYTAEHTSIQDDPSPEIIYNTGELAQLGGTDVSSLQEIPDEDDSQAPEGADQDASDTLSHIGLQVDDKPHNLRKPDHAMSHTEVDPDVYLPENDNVLGRGDRSFTDKGLKIAAYSPPDVVVDGPKPQTREVRDSAESSGFSENGSCLNANLQNKSNIQHPHEHVDVGNASVAMNPSEATPLRDSDVDGLSPTERPAATVNDGNKKGFSRFMNLRNKQKEVAAYMKKAGKIFKVKTEDLKEDDIIIAIMGPTGAGKSSFINMATGNATGVGHDLESCTNSIDILKFQCIERSMQDIIFVDTPGFDDTHKSDVEILEMIAGWLKQTYEQNNTDKSAWNIIDSIVVGHNERYAVELQKELVDLEKELPETGAGKELFSKLQALVKRQQDTLHRLRESMKRHDDETILNALKEEYEELRLQTEATVKEMEVLKIPIGKRLRRLFTSTLGFFKLFKNKQLAQQHLHALHCQKTHSFIFKEVTKFTVALPMRYQLTKIVQKRSALLYNEPSSPQLLFDTEHVAAIDSLLDPTYGQNPYVRGERTSNSCNQVNNLHHAWAGTDIFFGVSLLGDFSF
ncbi:hypothetical protein AB1N83_006534 [Pleurotus pulmonarius]